MNYLNELTAYRDREIKVYQKLNLDDVNTVMNILEEARKTGRHIFIWGNGGSAATGRHYAGDFNTGDILIGISGSGNSKNVINVRTVR